MIEVKFVRLFIAINFENEMINKLVGLRDDLQETSSCGRFSLPENLHLTLAFLGECDDKQTAAAKAAMEKTTLGPFDLVIDHIGRFKRDGGDIWWAGVQENKSLLDLQQKLSAELRKNGFRLENRKYSPHITLGREVETSAKPRPIEQLGETVSKIDLMKSERINGKLTYTSIYRCGKRVTPIVVEPYNPKWATEFEKIRSYLLSKKRGHFLFEKHRN